MKNHWFMLSICLFSVFCGGCGKKKSPGVGGGVGSLAFSSSGKLPSTLQPGLIVRYNQPGLPNRVVGYIYDVNEGSGFYSLQYMVLDNDGERYFYGDRKVPLENIKYGHAINQSFSFNGGMKETTSGSTTFFGSDEILKQLRSTGETSFAYASDRTATSLHRREEETWELNYNGNKISVPMLLGQTGPLQSRFHRPILIGLHAKPGFPLLLRASTASLVAVEEVGYVAAELKKHFESKGSLLTGSLYCAIFNLSDGSPAHLMWMRLSQDLWKQAILPVIQSQPSKKWAIELFVARNGKPAVVTKGNLGKMNMAVKMLQGHVQQDCPSGQCTVRLGSSLDNLPAEFSPVGNDPEVRLSIHPES